MFICGNDAEAKKAVSRICSEFGWGVIDIGGIEGSEASLRTENREPRTCGPRPDNVL